MQNQQLQNGNNLLLHNHDESILVIQRSILFKHEPAWSGIKQNHISVHQLITQHECFIPRSHAETNFAYKQIIPYVIFMHNNKLFVMQRKATANEARLASKFSIGIGGHIRHTDVADHEITSWAQREFNEEVTYHGNAQTQILGVLNDDSNDVGKVHLGIVVLMQADSDQISINHEHKSGLLLTKDECLKLKPQMETWSQMCLDFLIDQKLF